MGDAITSCQLFFEADGVTKKYYAVTFYYEGLDVWSGWNPIYVYCASMVDPNDMSEVKALALAQAIVTKKLFATSQVIDSINGPVNI